MDKQTLMNIARETALIGKRAGRGIAEKLGLLDDADNNIGNALIVPPFGPTDGTAVTRLPSSNPRGERILFLDGLSRKGQTVTIGLAASTILKPNPPGIGSQSSPPVITATIEYGNGSQFSFIEVDVPIGRISFVGGRNIDVEDGATLVTVPAGTLRVWARNDSYYIVPDLSGLVGNSAGAPLRPPSDSGDADDAFVKAFVTYNTVRSNSVAGGPTRTYVIGRGLAGGGGFAFSNDVSLSYLVPPLAKRFRVLRTNGTIAGDMPALTGTVYDADNNALYNFSTLIDVIDPFKELPGVAHSVGVEFAIDSNGYAGIVWEIGA